MSYDDYEDYDERPRLPNWALPVGIAVGLLVLALLGALLPDKPRKEQAQPAQKTEEPQDEPDKVDAWVMAQQFVEDKLKTPGTAKWGWQTSDETVTQTGSKTFRVDAWVDSQNSFGALIRTRFTCDLEYRGDGNWRCTRLEFFE